MRLILVMSLRTNLILNRGHFVSVCGIRFEVKNIHVLRHPTAISLALRLLRETLQCLKKYPKWTQQKAEMAVESYQRRTQSGEEEAATVRFFLALPS